MTVSCRIHWGRIRELWQRSEMCRFAAGGVDDVNSVFGHKYHAQHGTEIEGGE